MNKIAFNEKPKGKPNYTSDEITAAMLIVRYVCTSPECTFITNVSIRNTCMAIRDKSVNVKEYERVVNNIPVKKGPMVCLRSGTIYMPKAAVGNVHKAAREMIAEVLRFVRATIGTTPIEKFIYNIYTNDKTFDKVKHVAFKLRLSVNQFLSMLDINEIDIEGAVKQYGVPFFIFNDSYVILSDKFKALSEEEFLQKVAMLKITNKQISKLQNVKGFD